MPRRAAGSGIEGRTAQDLAQTEAVTVDPSTTLAAAARLRVEHGTARRIVVSASEPIGIVSSLDIAGTLAWGRGWNAAVTYATLARALRRNGRDRHQSMEALR